ncbi:MAG: DUF2059 domain-containing protein [Myxococcota bacterium]
MTRFVRTIVAVTFLSLVLSSSGGASGEEISPEFRSKIIELMQVTGAAKLGEQIASSVVQQMIASLKESGSTIPSEAWDIVRDVTLEILLPAAPALYERVVPLYARYFSPEDIDALLAFYETPTGKKAIQVMPALMQESMKAGSEWARSKAPLLRERILQRLEEAGYAQRSPE